MNKRRKAESHKRPAAELNSELLILPNGRILVHNLTQPMAALLHELNPADETIQSRVNTKQVA